jgi:hypothetical protein
MYEMIIFVLGVIFGLLIMSYMIPRIVLEVIEGVAISVITKSNDEDDIND